MHVRRPFDWYNMQIECANSTSALHTQIRSTWAPSQQRQTQIFIAHSKWNSMLQLSSRMFFARVFFFSIIFKHRSNFMCAQTYWTCWVDSNAGWIIIIQQLHLMFEFHVENFTWKKNTHIVKSNNSWSNQCWQSYIKCNKFCSVHIGAFCWKWAFSDFDRLV